MEKGDNMENVAAMMPLLWQLIENNKKCSINVITKENDIIVSIWSGRRWKRFKNKTTDALISNIQQAYQV
ncbi:hypothetical protein UFOVP260_17 [uncultured Caudovirales phage]|uniref:Uncharacterized protein n=1 Tax=uncultured Caudovirales phage TaxID=2100421 RepID=A0A6J7WFP4_9CAUD|nr:hypothetical protein UFOVP85_45 [uncultured Caudovirales phage]CAB4132407.1 hypothetical protein UFOVP260_17 [uncultured Caudovirales phage]CAB4202707.1 hypothetical protein UFOVP1363_28 [uncultured Caudovirales phage]CAB5207010.1 hypothetical protein UFOVP179_2 [uncultured Caudovirales phage]